MSNYSDWFNQFKKEADIVLKVDERILLEAANVFTDKVVARTPVGNPALWKWPAHVGYHPGTLKALWQLTKISDLIYRLINETPYAQRVEDGWSSQAPAGMLRVTAKEWSFIVDDVAKRRKL